MPTNDPRLYTPGPMGGRNNPRQRFKGKGSHPLEWAAGKYRQNVQGLSDVMTDMSTWVSGQSPSLADVARSQMQYYADNPQDVQSLRDMVAKSGPAVLDSMNPIPIGIGSVMGKTVKGTHYGHKQYDTLKADKAGTGLRGHEVSRYAGERNAPNSVQFYAGPHTKEQGLGSFKHEAELSGILDWKSREGKKLARRVKTDMLMEAEAKSSGRFKVSLDQRELADAREQAAVAAGYNGVMATGNAGAVVKYFDDVPMAPRPPTALPNPDRARIANELVREEKWAALARSGRNAGVKRNKAAGNYVGANKRVNTPGKRDRLVREYADRSQRALDAGVPEGYFYHEGRGTLARLTETPEDHFIAAQLAGPTSTQVGPQANLDYMARAFDQDAMGVPSRVTLYPNSLRRSVDASMNNEVPFTGYKVDRYSNELGPEQFRDPNPLANKPPNDQWEGFGTGGDRGKVPSGPAQVAFADDVRARATRRHNRQRAAEGKHPLSETEEQELHWISIRHETELADEILKDMNKTRKKPLALEEAHRSPIFRERMERARTENPVALRPGDTFQGAAPGQTMQHSWEAQFGPTSGGSIGDMPIENYTDEVFARLESDQGKDKLVSAMGARLQEPMTRGPGVYEGVTSPGVQSRSLISQTKGRGLDPASEKRVGLTEHMRAFALGQDAYAGSSVVPVKAPREANALVANTGATPGPQQMQDIDALLTQNLGAGQAAPVFTPNGYRVLNTGAMDNPAFQQGLKDIEPQLLDVAQGDMALGKYSGVYGELPWGQTDKWGRGKVTKGLLDNIDDPNFPGAYTKADSPETRKVMSDIADMYDELQAKGITPPPKLKETLKAWGAGGVEAVRTLMARGLTPAAALAVLAAQQQGTQPAEGM